MRLGTRSSDFNYKVALASGLKGLQAGRLRQAEEQFRYLLARFPGADGGYRGLAKVLIEQEDRPAALRMLLDGGASVAKAGQRAAAIGLYRDATALDPHDLTAHRRLAAALTLAGEQSAAADEYVRYIKLAQTSGAQERARLEAEFALERIPPTHELVTVARGLGIDAPEPPPGPAPAAVPAPAISYATSAAPAKALMTSAPVADTKVHAPEDRAALMRSAFGGAPHASATPVETRADTTPAAEPESAEPETPVAAAAGSSDPWGGTVIDPEAVTLGESDGEQQAAADDDSQAIEAAAAVYLAKKDPRGGDAAIEAARRYIADGRFDAASDLLLQLIASGVADHDAQRLLVDVVRTLGKRDVAKAKCQLLVQALRLDGRDDLAAEVEQLALAD